jgi:hypothetical protein
MLSSTVIKFLFLLDIKTISLSSSLRPLCALDCTLLIVSLEEQFYFCPGKEALHACGAGAKI